MREIAGAEGVAYHNAGRRVAFSYILAAYIVEEKSMAKHIFEEFCSKNAPSYFAASSSAAAAAGSDASSSAARDGGGGGGGGGGEVDPPEEPQHTLATSAFNNALDVLDAHGHLEEARETFVSMRELGVPFNVRTLAIFIQVYTILNPKTAKVAFEKMLKGGMIEKSSHNPKVWSVVLSVCYRRVACCGCVGVGCLLALASKVVST